MISEFMVKKAYLAAQTAFDPEFIVSNGGFFHPYIMLLYKI